MSDARASLAAALAQARVAGLTDAAQALALAALVLRHQDAEAAKALAGIASDDDAHLWLWRLTTDKAAATVVWEAFYNGLPDDLVVPETLRDYLRAYALKDPPPAPMRPQHPVDPERRAWPNYLHSLDATDGFSIELFRTVLRQASASDVAHKVAAERLAAHGADDDVDSILAVLGGLPPSLQVQVLCAFEPPHGADVADAVAQQLEFAGSQGHEVDAVRLAELAESLDNDRLIEMLTKRPGHARRTQALAGAGLARRLGLTRIRVLLESGMTDESVRRLLDSVASDHRRDDYVDFAVYAFETYSVDHALPFLKHLRAGLHASERMRSRHGDDSRRSEHIVPFWEIVTRTTHSAAAASLGEVIWPDELAAADEQGDFVDGHVACRRGWVAGQVLLRDDWPDFEAAIREQLSHSENAGLMASYIAGIVDLAGAKVPDFVIDAAVPVPGATVPLVAKGLADRVIERVGALGPEAAFAAQVLADSSSDLNDDQRRQLMALVTWPHVGPVAFSDLVNRLLAEPTALVIAADLTLDSLRGPEATRAPEGSVAEVLAAVVTVEAVAELDLTTDRTDTLLALLMLRHPALVAAAADVVRHLEPTEQLVAGVADADQRTGATQPPIRDLRAAQAAALARTALDTARDHAARATALGLTETADPATARSAAFALATSSDLDLRTVAAQVLKDTPGDPADLDQLSALIRDEHITAIAEDLDAARRRLASGNLGEAVHNLFTMVGLQAPNVAAEVLVPASTGWSAAFMKFADNARARDQSAATDPGPFIDDVVQLTDVLVDVVLVAAHDAGGVQALAATDAEKIRSNAPKRPQPGDLIRRQPLSDRFRWFGSVTALRALRDAHPAPTGTTTPMLRGAEEAITARTLLRTIVVGWSETMTQLPPSD